MVLIFRYEFDFFQNVVNGREIVSWAAVDRSRPNGQSDDLVGFVTARIVLARESEVTAPHFLSHNLLNSHASCLFSIHPPFPRCGLILRSLIKLLEHNGVDPF